MKTYDYNCKYLYDFLDIFAQINDKKNLCYIKSECKYQFDDTITSLIVFATEFENKEFESLTPTVILNPLYEFNFDFYKYDLAPLYIDKKNEKFICYNLNDKKFYQCNVCEIDEGNYQSLSTKDNILLKDDFYAIEFKEFNMGNLVDFEKLSRLEEQYDKYFKLLYQDLCKNKSLNKLLNKKTYFSPAFGIHKRFNKITKNVLECSRKIIPENHERSVAEKLLGNAVVAFSLISQIHPNFLQKVLTNYKKQ